MKKTNKKTVVFLKYTSLPQEFKEQIREWCGFSNDCILPLRSELTTKNIRAGMISIYDYWVDQTHTNNYKGTLDDFVVDYGLKFEVWLIEQDFDLENVDKICIDISW